MTTTKMLTLTDTTRSVLKKALKPFIESQHNELKAISPEDDDFIPVALAILEDIQQATRILDRCEEPNEE